MKKFLHSFGYAFNGILYAFKTQLNFRVHCITAILVIIVGYFFQISDTEWFWVCFAVASVLSAELFNTAIEMIVDRISPEKNPIAGAIKDLAAAAVLTTALFALAVGLIIFLPKVVQYVA